MTILKKKKKTKVAAEPIEEEVKVEEVATEETIDEEIQTTFNDDQEGIFEDVVFVEDTDALEAEELEVEDC